MSSLLKEAIVDAAALREAALKNAESSIIDKYSDEVRTALTKLLEQDEDGQSILEKKGNKIGFVSLGCPKNLVDSERILTQLRMEGYEIVKQYAGADVVIVRVGLLALQLEGACQRSQKSSVLAKDGRFGAQNAPASQIPE